MMKILFIAVISILFLFVISSKIEAGCNSQSCAEFNGSCECCCSDCGNTCVDEFGGDSHMYCIHPDFYIGTSFYPATSCPSGGGGVAPPCFLPGTLIKTSTGSKKIEDIEIGDEVTSFENDKIVQSTVSQIYERKRDFYYSLTAKDYKVEASAEHPFYVGNGQFKEISKLKKGDTVYILQKNSLVVKKITSNTRINKSTPVYNLSVDNTHTYFANDFAVHNKMTCAEAFQKLALSWPSIRRTSETTAIIEWDLYTGPYDGTLSIMIVPESKSFGGGCPNCVVNEENINPKVTSSLEVNSLQSGTLYEMKATYYPIGYVCGGKTTTYLSSCTMAPDPLNLTSAGQTGTLTTNLNLTVNQKVGITYTSSVPAVATVSNLNAVQLLINSVNSHLTTVTAVSNGTTTVTSLAKFLVIKGEEFHWDQVCNDTATVNVGVTNTPTPTRTPTRTPTPTPTATPTPTVAPNSWLKLKNTSFLSQNSLTSLIPLVPASYDTDDDGTANFIIGTGGVVGAPVINITGLNASAKTSSPKEYKVVFSADESPSYLFTPSAFRSYIKARKQHTVITNNNLSSSEIPGSGIYVYQGAVALNINSTNSSVFNGKNVVLISQGTVTISDDFNPTGSVAIVADRINFGNTVAQVRGIFIANTIDSGTAGFGLKVIGNLIAQTSLIKNRTQANSRQPAIFVVYDPVKYNNFYVDLLPYLSTANYNWRQIQ